MSCQTCAIILDIYAADFNEQDEEFLGQVSDLLSSNCPHAESLPRAANFDRPLSDFPERLLAIRKEIGQTGVRLGLGDETPDGDILFDNISTTVMELVARDDAPDHPGKAMPLDSRWVDLDIVRGWITQCQTQHGGECHEPPWLEGVEAISPEWLIDVIDNCIVYHRTPNTPYLALSYTWGLGKNLKTTKATLQDLQCPGALISTCFAGQLPETIKNTMSLVKALGQRYLWVDALCIIQDDAESLRRNLNQMQLIYANSMLCIMATTGCGADFGLRGLKGLSPARELEMRVYNLADGDRLVAKSLSQDPTAGTKYSYHQRGWTFQEWQFSRRRLVFQHGPLEWHCQCAQWRENQKISLDADERFRSRRVALRPSPSIWSFMKMAGTFNTKALTVEEDAPKAFAGIQAMLHRIHPGGLLYGLSEFFFEIALAWSSVWSDIERRSSGIPSWSWLGWQGEIFFPQDAEFHLMDPWKDMQKLGFQVPVGEWFAKESPDAKDKRRISSEWHRYKTGINSSNPLVGWQAEPYNQQAVKSDFNFPGCEPEQLFCHEFNRDEKFKYPVPVLNWADTPTLSNQALYLYAETSRAFLEITPRTIILQDMDCPRRIRVLGNGITILSLTLSKAQQTREFINVTRTLELVAFAKGWSTWLGSDAVSDGESGL